jgi:hypothetical protein
VPRHVERLVTRLVVDYFASRKLVIDYLAYDTRPGASARRAARLVVDYFAYAAPPGASARRAARHTARRRLLRAPRPRLADTLSLLQPRRASRLLVS